MARQTNFKEIEAIRNTGIYAFPNGQTTELHIAAFFVLSREYVVDFFFKSGLISYRLVGNRYICRAADVLAGEFDDPTSGVSNGCRDTCQPEKTDNNGHCPRKRRKTQVVET